jgi:hypothetical protein
MIPSITIQINDDISKNLKILYSLGYLSPRL